MMAKRQLNVTHKEKRTDFTTGYIRFDSITGKLNGHVLSMTGPVTKD